MVGFSVGLLGLWQSLGLDGFYTAVVSVTEPLLDFKPEAIDKTVNILGEIGTALTILDVVRADLKGDNIGVASNTLKVLMAKTVGSAASAIGTPVMAASMSLVAVIGVALEKFGTMVNEHRKTSDSEKLAWTLYLKSVKNLFSGDYAKAVVVLRQAEDVAKTLTNNELKFHIAYWRFTADGSTFDLGERGMGLVEKMRPYARSTDQKAHYLDAKISIFYLNGMIDSANDNVGFAAV